MIIETRFDRRRGCGYRKEGGLYMVAPPGGISCGRFPIQVKTCPTCSGGIKPTRGFTWVNPAALFPDVQCRREGPPCNDFDGCSPRFENLDRAGLLWVGEAFYPRREDFLAEAKNLGISRRIPHVPNDFEIGRTWVLLGHRSAMRVECEKCEGVGTIGPIGYHGISNPGEYCDQCGGEGVTIEPGIIAMFRPTAVEYVTRGDETDEELVRLVKRGVTPVKVERILETEELFEEEIRVQAIDAVA